MTNEEMMKLYDESFDCYCCKYNSNKDCNGKTCEEAEVEWLKEESEVLD